MLFQPYLWPTAATRFFDENQANVRSPLTRRSWGQTLQLLHNSFDPPIRVDRYREEDLVRFLNQGRDPRSGKPWAGGTVLKHRTALKQFFSWAHHVKLTPKDPSAYLNRLVRPHATGVSEHHWLSDLEVDAVLATCDDTLVGRRDRMALAIGFYSGLRVSEIAGLTWDRVRADYLQVFGKGAKEAQAPMLDQLRDELMSWRTVYAEAIGATPFKQPVLIRFRSVGGGRVVREQELIPYWGMPLGESGLRNLLDEHGQAAGITGLSPHDMRRTFAGLLQDRGVPVETISQALRHDNISTTSRYLSKNPRRMHNALRGVRF